MGPILSPRPFHLAIRYDTPARLQEPVLHRIRGMNGIVFDSTIMRALKQISRYTCIEGDLCAGELHILLKQAVCTSGRQGMQLLGLDWSLFFGRCGFSGCFVRGSIAAPGVAQGQLRAGVSYGALLLPNLHPRLEPTLRCVSAFFSGLRQVCRVASPSAVW